MEYDPKNILDAPNFGSADSFSYFTSKQKGDLVPDLSSSKFEFAKLPDPSAFNNSIAQSSGKEKEIMNFQKGTTTLAFAF